MDAASRSFLDDLSAIRSDYVPRLKAAQSLVDELRRGAIESVTAACTLWAAQSDRPSAIRQAAKVATLRMEKGEACDLGMASARAVLATAFADRTETASEAEQREIREKIRAAAKEKNNALRV